MSATSSTPTVHAGSGRAVLGAGILVTLAAGGALVAYKGAGSLSVIDKVQRTGTLAPKAEWIVTADLPGWLVPFAGTVNYFSWVIIALTFGVVIGAAVKAFVPEQWIVRSLGAQGARAQLWAAVTGAPLMLCSCCVAPVFEGVYARTRRLGSALALMFAAPALNPAALTLTFLLFPSRFGAARVLLALGIVLLGSAAISRWVTAPGAPSCDAPTPLTTPQSALRAFGAALWETFRKSIPAIVLGALVSAVVMQWAPVSSVAATGWGAVAITLGVAVLSVLIVLPTFAEIPLALALMAAGAPDGAVLAMLVAGPAINASSLFSLAHQTSRRTAVLAGGVVFLFAAVGGIVLNVVSA